MTAPRIFVVEDDAAIAAGLVRGLRAAGFAVELAVEGHEGARRVLAAAPDLVVLDLMLPGDSGFTVLERIRAHSSVPVVVLTARAALDDRLRCLDLGAEDFLAKPFWMEELVARIRARLRLRDSAPRRVIGFDDVEVDLDARTVCVAGQPVAFTRHEFDLLAYLVERPSRALARLQLADAALPIEGDRDVRTVDSHVARVRRKLGPVGAARIATVWGIGYRFDPPEDSV